MLKLTGKKLTALAVAAISTLTISATAFAAAFTAADAQNMAAKLVPASATHVGTHEDFDEYEFKYFDNGTATQPGCKRIQNGSTHRYGKH